MTRTTLLIPLAASLMLGTTLAGGAFAQDQQPMPQQQDTATMQTANTGLGDPRQSTNGGMPIDQDTTVNGIQAACTGVADETENKARWDAYPVKIVLSGTTHQYFSGETVSIAKSDGSQIAQMTCNGPWVLMKLQPGAYHATVDLPGHKTKTVAFTAPSSGQREVNVVYTGAQETSDQTTAPADRNRATQAGFIQPTAKPADNSTVGNGAVDQPPMNTPPAAQPTMDQSPNNSDQPPQPK